MKLSLYYKNKKKFRQQHRNKSRVDKLRQRKEAVDDLTLSKKSTLTNEQLHINYEEENEKEFWLQYWFEEEERRYEEEEERRYEEDMKQNWLDTTQVYKRDKIHKVCSYGSLCFCETECEKYNYFMINSFGYEELAPRLDGRCYCGDIREDCPNYIEYGFDCQGFSKVIYK
jgi:hypothetical protein